VLLAALLVKGGRVVAADELAELVWDGQPPRGSRGALHSAVQRLRSTFGPVGHGLIHTRPPGYLIEVGEGDFDVRRFGLLAVRGRAAAEAGRWEQAAQILAEALGLWRGEPLADIPSQLLRAREIPHLEEQRLEVLAARIDADLHRGRHGEVVAELRQLLTAHPLRERFHAQLMLALYREGRQSDALTAYQDIRRVLADDLGVDPGPELQRLQHRILAADPELLIAESSGPRMAQEQVVPAQLPGAVRHFAGREGELRALAGMLSEPAGTAGTVVISAIDGTAGIGKTALAVHFAHQAAARFPDGQLYVNLRGFDPSGSPVTVAEAVRGFLDAFAVDPRRIPASFDAAAALYRSLLAGKRVLVVLDNARDARQVRPLLPGSPSCLVVVTSRSQLTSLVATEGAHPLTLGLLTAGEARELLTRRLGSERIAGDPQAADELIVLCARLPLALNIAAARAAAHPGFPLAALATELRDSRGRLAALDAGDAAASVGAVFSWSYRQLSGPAARTFRLLGLHPGPDISVPASASLAGVSLGHAGRALAELTRAHLITEHAPGRFTFHDLLRAYAAGQASVHDSDTERQAAIRRGLDHYLHTACAADRLLIPARDPIALAPPQPGVIPGSLTDPGQALGWFRAEHQVLLAATAQAADAGFDVRAWQLPWALATFLDRQGHWQDWDTTQRIALAAARRSGDAVGLAHAHRQLGRIHISSGSHADAGIHLAPALDLFRDVGDEVAEARTRLDIARALEGQGQYREAIAHAVAALDLFEAVGHQTGQARALNGAGWCYARLGEYEQALDYCKQALALHRELGYRSGESATLDSLGYAHEHLGHHAEAIDCYRRSLALSRADGDRYGEADALSHLGDAHHGAGDLEAARDYWQQALAILDDLRHPDAGHIRARLATPEPENAPATAARHPNR